MLEEITLIWHLIVFLKPTLLDHARLDETLGDHNFDLGGPHSPYPKIKGHLIILAFQKAWIPHIDCSLDQRF